MNKTNLFFYCTIKVDETTNDEVCDAIEVHQGTNAETKKIKKNFKFFIN